MFIEQKDVLLIYDVHDEVAEVNKRLSSLFNSFQSVDCFDVEISYYIRRKPGVIIFALASTEKSINLYSDYINEHQIKHPHVSILMSDSKHAKIAFECCIRGLFDDFIIYKPLIEVYSYCYGVYRAVESINPTIKKKINFKYDSFQDEILEDSVNAAANLRTSTQSTFRSAQAEIQSLNIKESSQVSKVLDNCEKKLVSEIDVLIKDLSKAKKAISGTIDSDELSGSTLADVEQDFESVELIDESLASKTKKILAEQDESDSVALVNNDLRKNILIAEDNSVYRKVLVKSLIKLGYSVHEAENGREAVEMVKTLRFDIAFLDLFMPQMDGIQTTKTIRKLQNGKDLPIIALTGNKKKDIAKKWIQYGIQGYLLKPTTARNLEAMISRHMRKD